MVKKYLPIVCVFCLCVFLLPLVAQHMPGTFENAAPASLEAVLALDKTLNLSGDELVVYYVRPDKNYAPWALWVWANPGGDGNALWSYTQRWSEKDGIGYMRLRLDGSDTGGVKPVAENGGIGLIVRQKDGWIKDGDDDRLWNVNTSKKIVIFSGDTMTYAAEPYKPSITSAELSSPRTINLTLSGKYALGSGASGFVVSDEQGKRIAVVSAQNADGGASNFTAGVALALSENAPLSTRLRVSHADFRGTTTVDASALTVKIAEQTVPSENVQLGMTYENGSASFALWAPTSSSATLNLYLRDTATRPDYTVRMIKNDATGVWWCRFAVIDPDGMFYDFTLVNAHGSVTVLDPYAVSMAAYRNDGTVGRGAIVDLNSPKALPDGGMASYVQLAKREDAVIYEMSVRDFTISSDAHVRAVPGTYAAFIEKIPYLKSLGITHVQLMPVINFFYNDEFNTSYENSGSVNGNNYNWGYDPHNYFTPEGWFATDARDPYCRVRELRELVNECHKAGIGVLLDVVYNHMAETRFLDDIVPGYYFRMNERGSCTNASGCGNDTATERTMMKRLVVDSTLHWVKNYMIDGFRFDLMGLMESSSVLESYAACAKVNPFVLFEGEGWKMYNGSEDTVGMDQNYMTKTDNVAVFNDEFRDLLKAGGFNETGRGFITGKGVDSEKLFRNCIGSPVVNYRADSSGDNLQYLVCHDGLTLHDSVVHNLKLDEMRDRAEIIKRLKLGNFFALTSQGIAFLHGGQERGRTKPNVANAKNECIGNFVRNSYDSSDNINQFVWEIDEDYQTLLDYTKSLIALRRAFNVFRIGDATKIAKRAQLLQIDDAERLVFGYSIQDGDSLWIILVNGKKEAARINVRTSLKNARVIVDAENVNADGIKIPKGVAMRGRLVILDGLTATIIRVEK